jgi:hypothetical protein
MSTRSQFAAISSGAVQLDKRRRKNRGQLYEEVLKLQEIAPEVPAETDARAGQWRREC